MGVSNTSRRAWGTLAHNEPLEIIVAAWFQFPRMYDFVVMLSMRMVWAWHEDAGAVYVFEWVGEWIGEAITNAGGCVGEAAAASA